MKPKVSYNSTGPSGNIFFILAMVKREVQPQEYKEIWEKVKASSSYKEALSVIKQHVDLTDLDGKE